MRVAVLAVFLVLSGMLPAAAQDATGPANGVGIEAVLRDAGLFGTWAVDCEGAPTPANPHVSILLGDAGNVIERHELGDDYEINNYRVIAAKRLSRTRVSVEVLFKPGSDREEEQSLVLAVENGTRRTMFNRIAGGAVVVKDGVVAGHKVKTPALKKCG
ncbi:MAG TPA: hypothetical protein VFP74_13470 [Pseudolabrys sp.]|jgi:hypothetical protein|nr:hypothetical protein [Pseudolabrys sp.]HEX2539190.1 hypothetical protein [Pseudolabrys sp.]